MGSDEAFPAGIKPLGITAPNPPHLLRRRYRLTKWLGRGNNGVTYLAQDESLDRPVVIKFFDPGETSGLDPDKKDQRGAADLRNANDQRTPRFISEARRVARLSHPNIRAIYDVGHEQGWDYLVLEYIPGLDLSTRLKQCDGQMPVEEAMGIAASLLHALAYAHEQGSVHRNIKPKNILISAAGQVKVADFSLGDNQDALRLAQDDMLAHRLVYLAPESLRGVDSSSGADLYSLGAVLYELLTGRLPFEGENLPALLSKIIDGTIEPLRSSVPSIFPELEGFVFRLLSAQPGMRYASAGDALLELERMRGKAAGTKPGTAQPDKAHPLIGASSELAAAVEANRRHLAEEIEANIIDPLNLLLAQANTFEQTLPGQSVTRQAVSVLASLARQVLQRARDLEDNLHPAVLQSLGLAPAFEALVDRYERTHNLRLITHLVPLPERLPANLELELFRLTLAALDALCSQHITQVALGLMPDGDRLKLELSFAAPAYVPESLLAEMRQRLASWGGEAAVGRSSQGESHLSMCIPRPHQVSFTQREQQVLDGLMQGLSNKQIAARLAIRPRTVNYHLDNIYSKLGVRTRTEAVLIASRKG